MLFCVPLCERALALTRYYLRKPSAYATIIDAKSRVRPACTHADVTVNSTDFQSRARAYYDIINWAWLQNSRDMLRPLQNPRSATVMACNNKILHPMLLLINNIHMRNPRPRRPSLFIIHNMKDVGRGYACHRPMLCCMHRHHGFFFLTFWHFHP